MNDIPIDAQHSAYHFELPSHLIAQQPVSPRDAARMMVVARHGEFVADAHVADLPRFLPPDALLVLNKTRVIPARFWARRATGGRVEVLLLGAPQPTDAGDTTVEAMMQCRGKLGVGEPLDVVDLLHDENSAPLGQLIVGERQAQRTQITIPGGWLTEAILERIGVPPLPPYIKRDLHKDRDKLLGVDRERYQTVYASEPGAVAAPTAGMHFTQPLLERLDELGVERQYVTLHVGLDTFAPVRSEDIRAHEMHSERFSVPWDPDDNPIEQARKDGRPVVAVGTTTARVLETIHRNPPTSPGQTMHHTNLFVHPPQTCGGFDGLLTNFHTPESTLILFVSSVLLGLDGEGGGRDALLARYREAIDKAYRFFSYGDAMLILPPGAENRLR